MDIVNYAENNQMDPTAVYYSRSSYLRDSRFVLFFWGPAFILCVVMSFRINPDNLLKLVFIIRPYHGIMLRVLHAK